MFPEPDLTAAHGRGVGGGDNQSVLAEVAPVQGLHGQQNGHNLGHAGRGKGLMGVFLKENRPRLLLHQQGGGRFHIHRRSGHRQDQRRTEQQHKFFHGDPSL